MSSFKEQWRAKGEMTNSPNSPHEFQIGRLLVQWQFAKDSWASVNEEGILYEYIFLFCRVKTLSGVCARKLVVGRFSLLFGLKKWQL